MLHAVAQSVMPWFGSIRTELVAFADLEAETEENTLRRSTVAAVDGSPLRQKKGGGLLA